MLYGFTTARNGRRNPMHPRHYFIPCVAPRAKLTVLVEEDESVRKQWIRYYEKNQWDLIVFENPLEFFGQLDNFRDRTEKVYFFFDQDFGRVRGVGVEMARAVKGLNPAQSVSLITNYDPEDFHSEVASRLVDYVFGKFPEPIFGEEFFDEDFREDFLNSQIANINQKCALEQALGFEGVLLEFKLEKHYPSLAPKKATPPIVTISPLPSSSMIGKPTSWWERLLFRGAGA